MSYNHENGNVLFYKDEIEKLRKMDIEFFDARMIKDKQRLIKYLK